MYMKTLLFLIILTICVLASGCVNNGVDPAFSYIINKRFKALEAKTNTVVMYEISGEDLKLLLEHLRLQEEKTISILNKPETNVVFISLGIAQLPITITKNGEEWVGPRGERYSKMPTKNHLQSIYGR